MSQEEKGFEIIDKRRIRDEDGGSETPQASAEAGTERPSESKEGAQEPTAGGEEAKEPLPPIKVPELVALFINQLAAVAWQRMGLVPDPLSGKIEKDMEQARLAIDSAAVLLEKLEPSLSEIEKRDFRVLLSNLRVNFVKQS